MGCSNSKVSESNPTMRMLEYERMAEQAEKGLKVEPKVLDNEDWKEGLISARTFYNWFHAGFCSAYIQNPQYMLIIDFRNIEDWLKERIKTSIHYKHFQNIQKFVDEYVHIILYDKDGSSIGNVRSPIRKLYLRFRPNTIPYASQVGLEGCSTETLDIAAKHNSESETEEPEHELEVVRPSPGKIEPEAIANGGRVLVHGCDGLDQSAAVVISAIMQYHTATLEDSLYYVAYSRPGLCLSNHRMRILWELESELFGRNVTELETLWI